MHTYTARTCTRAHVRSMQYARAHVRIMQQSVKIKNRPNWTAGVRRKGGCVMCVKEKVRDGEKVPSSANICTINAQYLARDPEAKGSIETLELLSKKKFPKMKKLAIFQFLQ